MHPLNLPEYSFKYRILQGKRQIFDPFRKKYVVLTAEEWVRQNFLAWLTNDKQYPSGLIAVEKELLLNDMKKRYDIVVYNNHHLPALLVECKSPGVEIKQSAFDQAARYKLTLKVRLLVVTNGLEHYCCSIDVEKGTYYFLDQVPDYNMI